jgi:oxygen-dependent protoporphyrinogen oxidase
MTTVGVVGAGVTGLALAHHLVERGADPVVFEADDRPGGVVRSGRVEDTVVEYGPQRVRLTDPLAELVEEVGLREDLVVADDDLPLFVYRGGRLRRVPRSLDDFLRTDLLSWRSKLRVLAEPLTDAVDGEELVADALARKFGAEAYHAVVEPLAGGVYAADPAEMRVRHAFPALERVEAREGSLLRPALRRAVRGSTAPPVSFEDGLGRLPERLAEYHADRVHLGTPVEAVERARNTPAATTDGGERSGLRGEGDGWRLRTADGDHRVDRVVLTTPADAAADLLAGVAPTAADRLAALTYSPVALVYLRSSFDRPGFGYQVAGGEGFRTRGVTFNASLFDREGLYTCFFGGTDDPGAVDADDEDLAGTARREFRRVTGADAEVLAVERVPGYPAHDLTWDGLDDLTLPDGLDLATNYTGRIGVPSRVRGARELAAAITG